MKKMYERKYSLFDILIVISFLFIATLICFYYLTIFREIEELRIEIAEIQDVLKLKEIELENVKERIIESTDSLDSNVIAARNDMRKFYILTGLGVTGALGLGIYGVWVWKGFTLYGFFSTFTPKFLMSFFAQLPFGAFHHVNVIQVVDNKLALTWVLEIINDSTARILVSPFASPEQQILASIYFSKFSTPTGAALRAAAASATQLGVVTGNYGPAIASSTDALNTLTSAMV